MNRAVQYFWDVVSALSQVVNALAGGLPCESVSGRAYRTKSWLYPVLNTVFFWDDDHCKESFMSDVSDADLFFDSVEKLNALSDRVDELFDADLFDSIPTESVEVVATSDVGRDLTSLTVRIADNAEHYEMNPEDMMKEYSKDKEAFVEAAKLVNWPNVVSEYSDDVLMNVLGAGTEFNFKGHEDLLKDVLNAVRSESAKRAPKPRKTNGMVG